MPLARIAPPLDRAIGDGVWRDENLADLRAQLGHLDAAGAEELLHKLVMAVNSGSVRMETTEGLF